jgi:hypothetical protein
MLNIKEILNRKSEPKGNLLARSHLSNTSDQFILGKASSLGYSRESREGFK